ncbi:MAG: hypothetical protein MJ059_05405 [Lachnospiraceae bacterium]|nr:hypothetical protein [Lachnospiraceae bacterium]
MKPYTGIMFGFAVVSLIPILLFMNGEGEWLRQFNRSRVKNKKEYARFLGKVTALIATSCLVSGLISLILPSWVAAIFLAAGCVFTMRYAIKGANEHYL